ncbi:MAG TPA: ABC transporter permease [Solirubrobacterales bacterium]|nr:ABC transporter permease [Solirubrobacterales bacterium]
MPQLTATKPTDEVEISTPPPETIRLQATRGFGRVLAPRELWRFRDLAFQIAARDVTIRYRQTAFGAAWAILQPLAFMAVFTVIFGRLAGIDSDGLPYTLFSLAALVPWMFFANAFLLGSESLVLNQALISKIYFPRIFIPAGVVAAGCVDFTISLLILLTIVLVYGIVPSVAILALPLLIAIAIMTALGAAAGLSAINVRYRDVRYVIPFATQIWFFITPIVYPNSSLSEPLQTLSAINPMVGVVEGFRWAVLDSGSAPWDLMGISFAAAAVLLFAGLAYFDRVERSFADLI